MRLGQPATTLSGRRGPAREARDGALEGGDRPDALHPRRADHGPAHVRHREAPPGAPAPGRRGEHGARHRAQPGCREAVRLGARPRARGRRRRGRDRRSGHARGDRRDRRAATPASTSAGCCRCTSPSARRSVHSPASGPPDMTLRARAVIPDTEGRVLLDRTHHPAKDAFYWFPGGGVEPGETAEEAVKRELVEEAAVQIDVLKPLYLSENLFVESGEYRHEVILYFLAAIHARLETPPVDLRNHEWHPPSATPRAAAAAGRRRGGDVRSRDGLQAPAAALRLRRASGVTKGVRRSGKTLTDAERRRLGKARRAARTPAPNRAHRAVRPPCGVTAARAGTPARRPAGSCSRTRTGANWHPPRAPIGRATVAVAEYRGARRQACTPSPSTAWRPSRCGRTRASSSPR